MTHIRVVGEDTLCCALGERLVGQVLPHWELVVPSINAHGVTKLQASLGRYQEQAVHVQPLLCIADTDHQCPVSLLRRWLPKGSDPRFLLRFAVSEAESWLLADREGAAAFFGVATKHVPRQPEEAVDAKRTILSLARRSAQRHLRQEMISLTDLHRPGSGYNFHLSRFAATHWQVNRALAQSDSLRRAVNCLESLAKPARGE